MPLSHSSSPQAFKKNLKTELAHGKPMKQSLAIAYNTKRSAPKKMAQGGDSCPACRMAEGGMCMDHSSMRMAEGGAVDEMRPLHTKPEGMNPEMEDSTQTVEMAPHERLDGPTSEESSEGEKDLPQEDEHLSLAEAVMKDRKRRMFAKGGMVERDGEQRPLKSVGESPHSSEEPTDLEEAMKVGSLHGSIDPTDSSDLTKDQDELDAPMEDGRPERGLNISPSPTMTDPEHDQSNASLVAAAMDELRKKRKQR